MRVFVPEVERMTAARRMAGVERLMAKGDATSLSAICNSSNRVEWSKGVMDGMDEMAD